MRLRDRLGGPPWCAPGGGVVMFYNFCWRPGKLRVTPAMAAGAVDTLWSFDTLMGAQGR